MRGQFQIGTGDDSWLQSHLPVLECALDYLMQHPHRWSGELELPKREFTLDAWPVSDRNGRRFLAAIAPAGAGVCARLPNATPAPLVGRTGVAQARVHSGCVASFRSERATIPGCNRTCRCWSVRSIT